MLLGADSNGVGSVDVFALDRNILWKALILGNAAHGVAYYVPPSHKVGAKIAHWDNQLTFHQCLLSQNPRNSPDTLSTTNSTYTLTRTFTPENQLRVRQTTGPITKLGY